MMMFASDLDRTLIYSKRALTDFNQSTRSDLMAVERKNGEDVAFMTNRAFELLQELATKLLIVPVTTRTYEQYNRVFFFSQEISSKYAVTSNGANIVYKGKPLLEWNEQVQKQLQNDCLNIEKMMDRILTFNVNGTLKVAEGLFFYFILENILHAETINHLRKLAEDNGWRISIQGRKLYFMPNPVSKGNAVQFIKEREGIQTVFGAGDSILDHDFLKHCQYSYVPSHGELVNVGINKDQYIFTLNQGVQAGEEIIGGIADELKVKSF
jgi:hydroxymethylpyrimidine pyrophosphatase-like HAD family hydrolase